MASAIALPRSVPTRQKWAALGVLMAGTFMMVLDSSS